MVIKSDLNLLQLEVKKLAELKESHNKMVNKYKNEIFPSYIEKFYKYKLSLINLQMLNSKEIIFNNDIELDKKIYSIEKSKLFLGSYYDLIYDFFLLLRKEPKILINILNNIDNQHQEILINYISLIYFENVFQLNNNEINCDSLLLNILDILIEKELDSIINDESNNYSKFLNDSLASKLIKNFLKFEDVQNYLKIIFSEIILDIMEMENKNVFIEPNKIRDYLFPINNISAQMEGEINELDEYKKSFRSTLNKKNKKTLTSKNSNKLLRKTFNFSKFKSKGALSKTNTETNLSSIEFDKSFRETISSKNYSTNLFFNENEITNLLYNNLTHTRLIYSLKEQKIFFNNDDENNLDIYRPINLDEFLKNKEKNPDFNPDYSKYELSKKELYYRYTMSGKYNKYMQQFYYSQYKLLKKTKEKSYSNMSFLKSMKNGFQNIEEIINQYKINFEKIKYFIDKMIYKILQDKDDNLPFCIKNIINKIYNYFVKLGKKDNKLEVNGFIYEFFIGKIIIPFLTNEEMINIITGQKIDKEAKAFLFYFSKIIKKIFRSNFYDSLDKDFTIFNIYICEILPYIDLIISNFIESQVNIKFKTKEEDSIFCRIINHESFIINEKIMKLIFDYLFQNDNNKIKKLFESNEQLNNYFNLINENYKTIIQTFEENKENDEFKLNNLGNNNNIFGSTFLILTKEEFLEINENRKFSLSISNETNKDNNNNDNNNNDDNNNILLKIKYSLLKFLEHIPSNFFNQNFQLIKNKSYIKIFEEIKKIFMKKYINNFLIENNIGKVQDTISFIWYLDYFLKYNSNLPEKYILNDFEKLFYEIELDVKNEIFKYKNDMTEFNFNLIINNNINTKLNSIKNSYTYYYENISKYFITDYIFNKFKENIEIYIYEKDERKYLFFNKLPKNNKEMTYLTSEVFNNIENIINYFSYHIIEENILKNFEEIENKYTKKLSLIDNVNTFLEDFIMILKDYVINIINPKKEENGAKNIEKSEINIKNEDIEKIIYIIEELINKEIYNRIWENQKSKKDEELSLLYENKLNKKTPKDIGINAKYINEQIWENIISLMKSKYNLNNFKTPMDKIKCVENIYKIIDKSLIVITSKQSDYSVDDIFPIFVYFLIQTKFQSLITNLNFIKLLIRKKNLIKSSGFALIQLEMAIQFLRSMD